jgi:hypothetical protein
MLDLDAQNTKVSRLPQYLANHQDIIHQTLTTGKISPSTTQPDLVSLTTTP